MAYVGKIHQALEQARASVAQLPTSDPAPPFQYYGNTEAVVLDIECDSNGRIIRLDKPRSLFECETRDVAFGERFKRLGQQRIKDLTKMLECDDYTSKRPASCQRAHKALAKYRGYVMLFGERKYASEYPSTDSTVNMWAKLPGEIRNKIYRMVLVMEPGMELAPRISVNLCNDINAILERSVLRRSRLLPILRLLRLSRQIKEEASDVFYGENEFRFTGRRGWELLYAFLLAIGPANVARLRRLIVCVPWKGHDQHGRIFSTEDNFQRYLAAMGLARTYDHELGREECVARSFAMLEGPGRLQVLRLILSTTYRLEERPSPLRLDVEKFTHGKLRVFLALLAPTESHSVDDLRARIRWERDLDADDEEVRTMSARQMAEMVDGEVEGATIDLKGRYPESHGWWLTFDEIGEADEPSENRW